LEGKAIAESFDYVIVGAGSAGSVLAGRLSEGDEALVSLFEAGSPDGAWTVKVAAAVSINIKGTRHSWRFATEPETFLDGRRIVHPRGRVPGWSSSLRRMGAFWPSSAHTRNWRDEVVGQPGATGHWSPTMDLLSRASAAKCRQ